MHNPMMSTEEGKGITSVQSREKREIALHNTRLQEEVEALKKAMEALGVDTNSVSAEYGLPVQSDTIDDYCIDGIPKAAGLPKLARIEGEGAEYSSDSAVDALDAL